MNNVVAVQRGSVRLCPEKHRERVRADEREAERLDMTDEMRVVVRDAFKS